MYYRTNEELPVQLRNMLPPTAQQIYRKAFNDAYQNIPEVSNCSLTRAEAAHHKAWETANQECLKATV